MLTSAFQIVLLINASDSFSNIFILFIYIYFYIFQARVTEVSVTPLSYQNESKEA